MAVYYIDKKWLYTTNCRCKVKKLPLGKHEPKGVEYVPINQILLRRFPVKIMFMSVICRPVPHMNCNGKIHTERVIQTRVMQKITAHTNFCDNVLINNEMNNSNWCTLVTDNDMSIIDTRYLCCDQYLLDDAIFDQLEFYYKTKVGRNGNIKVVRLVDEDKIIKKY